jgi:hypothetical protein
MEEHVFSLGPAGDSRLGGISNSMRASSRGRVCVCIYAHAPLDRSFHAVVERAKPAEVPALASGALFGLVERLGRLTLAASRRIG